MAGIRQGFLNTYSQVMHQTACEFDFGNSNDYQSPERFSKLKTLNEKLILKIEQKGQRQDLNETRLMSYERVMQTFLNFQREQDRQITHLKEKVQKQDDKPPRTELNEIGEMQMEFKKSPIEKNVERLIKTQKLCFYCYSK